MSEKLVPLKQEHIVPLFDKLKIITFPNHTGIGSTCEVVQFKNSENQDCRLLLRVSSEEADLCEVCYQHRKSSTYVTFKDWITWIDDGIVLKI